MFTRSPVRFPLLAMAKALLLVWICTFSTAANADALTWFDGEELQAQARVVMEELQSAERYGLDSTRYALQMPAAQVQRIHSGIEVDIELRRRFDAALSTAAAQFLTDLRYGRVGPKAVGFHLPDIPETFDADLAARRLAIAADVPAAIESYEPPALPYGRLKKALRQYRELASRKDLAPLAAATRRSIREGEAYADVARLHALLLAFGDLEQGNCTEAGATVFDACLSQALRHFQQRHGLIEDGILGPKTIEALNVPLDRRIRQIELTMERWRWTSTLRKPDIVVNVPQFVLYALPRTKYGETNPLEMRVIVGESRPETRTPVFAEEIEYVIFQPFWDVPASITRRELLPLIRKDSAYLARNGMEIVRGFSDNAAAIDPSPEALNKLAAGELRLRQRPGAGNALGSVKFILPNPHNVYLHATPNARLFEQTKRAFSHGCIRVSEPALLAEYVLKSATGEWNTATIQTALCDPATRRVDLETPISVLIFYGTAVVTASEGVMFFEDIYGHDQDLDVLLRTAATKAR